MNCERFAPSAKIGAGASECFRWNPALCSYELVLDGVAVLGISRFALKDKKRAAKFRQRVVLLLGMRAQAPEQAREQVNRHG